MPKAEETRALIIEKTAPVFNRKGYVGTTLTDMEEATGLTKGSIYNNFSNKDEVALAVFDHNLKKFNAFIDAEMSGVSTAIDRLLVYPKVYSGNIFKAPFPQGGCPILNTAVEADDTHPDLRKKAGKALLDWKNKIVSIIEAGVKSKEFKASVKPEETAFAIVATIEGAVMIAKLTGKSEHTKTIMKTVEKLIQTLA
jgi:AcrR family transcriptional regulator